jgi:hypothetical protein
MNEIKRMARTDPRLNQGERMVLAEIFPLIDELSEEIGESLDLMVFIMTVRRMATRGKDLEELTELLYHHYEHQLEYNDKTITH